jgi:hypothetical protein
VLDLRQLSMRGVYARTIERPISVGLVSMPIRNGDYSKGRTSHMLKIILTIVVAGVIAGSSSEIAFSKGRQHIRNARQVSTQQFRDAKASVARSYVSDPGAAYTGAAGAWATMTGFN